MTAAPTLLELRGLRVERGGVDVLDVPAFHLREDEVVALIGPNGSGKTTLLLALMGLLEGARGTLLHRGRAVVSRREALEHRRRISMVLQEPLLFDTTVHANIAAGLKIRGVPRRQLAERVERYLERLQLAPLAQRAARKLSAGEARRVSLARALAVEPDVVLLDEPFANLDPPARRAIVDDLERALAGSRTAAIVVTHDPVEAFRLSDRLVVMDGGRIAQAGPTAEVMRTPANAFIARFVGMDPILDGVVARSAGGRLAVAVAGHEIAAAGEGAPGERVTVCLRPEDVILHAEAPAGAANVFRATIQGLSSSGPFLRLALDGAFPLAAYVTPGAFADLGLAVGRDVFASFGPAAVYVIHGAAGDSRPHGQPDFRVET
jgi:tungstate transport system ATP-binding protein